MKPSRLSIDAIPESLRKLTPLIILLIALVVFGSFVSRQFLSVGNMQTLFGQITVLGILSVAMMFLLIAGQIDLSVGSGAALLSVIAARMFQADMPEWLVAIVLIVIGVIIGAITGVIVSYTRVQPFILTLGVTSVLLSLALIIADQQPLPVGSNFEALAIDTWGPLPITAWVFVGLCVLGSVTLRFTRFGRSVFALGSNEEAAFVAGVPVFRTKVGVYALSGALVGVAGIALTARLGAGDPNGGIGLELGAIVAVILGGAIFSGGRGTMLGAFLGTLLTGLITNVLQIAGVPAIFGTLLTGAILIIAVTWSAMGEKDRNRILVRGSTTKRAGPSTETIPTSLPPETGARA